MRYIHIEWLEYNKRTSTGPVVLSQKVTILTVAPVTRD